MNSNRSNHCEGIAGPAMNGVTFTPDPSIRREDIRKSIELVQFHTRKGLWGFVFFLSASLVSWSIADYDLAGPVLPGTQILLDPDLFLMMIDGVFAVSTISDLILIAGRLNDGTRPARIWQHVGFRTIFYLFYLLGGLLPLRFFAVFFAGVLVIGFEQAVLYLYAARIIREERALLGAIRR